jgi:integrase
MPPLKLKDIWAIRLRLELAGRVRDLALFSLALDSKLRGCELVRLRVADISHGEGVMPRATVIQHKTGRPVRFALTESIREAVRDWIVKAQLGSAAPSFRDGPTGPPTSRPASTPGSCSPGSRWCDWTPRTTGPTPCDAPRRRSSTAGPRTCEPCSSRSDTPSSKAQFGILE